eukprot:gb/GECG01007149.1/.p1 GENE.gb/GECG01007149.1/~~gb/GECG01007149.1/.p1  ORF type:complete len:421 (+),score=49.41 gb/GECG01007149.1/:1-1263(+)
MANFDSIFNNMLGGFGGFGGAANGAFQCNLRCYSMAASGKDDKERGDKVILPESKFQTLTMMQVQWPIQFKVSNENLQRYTHVGVLEFTAPEGRVYVPHWIMQNLLVEEGDMLRFTNVSLPKGTFVKIRPRSSDFLDISDPKAVLEMSLRNYSCLTKDDQVCINYNDRNYFFDVLELKPDNAVSIVETDMEVDFAPPADYEEPDYGKKKDQGNKIDFNTANATKVAESEESMQEKGPAPAAHDPNFVPFKGGGQRLDGKTGRKASGSASPALSSASSASGSNAGGGGQNLQQGASPIFGPKGGATLRDPPQNKSLEQASSSAKSRNMSPLHRAVNSGLGGSVIAEGEGFSLGPSATRSKPVSTEKNTTGAAASSTPPSGRKEAKTTPRSGDSGGDTPNKFAGRWKKPGGTFFTGQGKTLK